MALDPTDLPAAALAFMVERHLATLTTLRRDGSPHVVPVGFTWDREERIARVIATDTAEVLLAISSAMPRAASSSSDCGWIDLISPR